MTYRALIASTFAIGSAFCSPVLAETEDELVRLPGKGELRSAQDRERIQADRLKPGGGLFLTFDDDGDGLITQDEIGVGIPLAFAEADANRDGYLTALEQRAWANGLPTRDDSLANPTRFDPNLDRRVDLGEFTAVVTALSIDYADADTGLVVITHLKSSDGTSLPASETSAARRGPLAPARQDGRSQR